MYGDHWRGSFAKGKRRGNDSVVLASKTRVPRWIEGKQFLNTVTVILLNGFDMLASRPWTVRIYVPKILIFCPFTQNVPRDIDLDVDFHIIIS